MKVCEVPDCGLPNEAKGLCSKHYQAWRRTGVDPRGLVTEKQTMLQAHDALRDAGQPHLTEVMVRLMRRDVTGARAYLENLSKDELVATAYTSTAAGVGQIVGAMRRA